MGVADLDPDFWRFGMTLFSFGAVSPWLSMLDHAKYGRYVDEVERLGINTVAACHTPVITGAHIPQAFAHVRDLPIVDPPPLPDQSILDQIIAATATPAS
jgi:hypothetical protein